MKKLELIVKPTQSGKTFIMLQEIAKMLETDDDIIHIIFCDNQLLQTEQTSSRLDNYDDLEQYVSEDGDISLILSSKSNIRKYSELTHHICGGIKTIVTCSNKKRIQDINKLINHFLTSRALNTYSFCLWIDEIDKNISSFKRFLINWNDNEKIKRIGLITATPKKVLKNFEYVKIYQLNETYDRDIYHRFCDSSFDLLNYDGLDIESYISKVLTRNSKIIQEGQVWFIPGEINMASHYNIKNILIENGFNVIVINGDGKQFYKDKNNYENIGTNKVNLDTISDILGKLYVEKNLKNKKVAITGNLCVNRGITINSDKMLLTHAIFPAKISDPCNMYQLAGRICGNIKKFANYKKPSIFCTEKFKNIVCEWEQKAINLSEKAFKLNNIFVTNKDYLHADAGIMNSGIPIKLNISNEDDLNFIIGIKQISEITKPKIQQIIKKYKLENYNIDFNINNYKLRNKYCIGKENVDSDGRSKYEYQNFQSHFNNRKMKEPNINCRDKEYLIYLITDEIVPWNAKKGDAFIIYRNENNKETNITKKIIYKINGIKCIKEDDDYYDYSTNKKGKLIAITNEEGEVELVDEEEEEKEKEEYEFITIGKKDYILIDENVYTIINDEPDELYGKYANGKFTKFNNDKIIVKGRKQKTDEELEAELELGL